MTDTLTANADQRKLRLWPGVAALVLQLLFWFVVPVVFPGSLSTAFLGALACAALVFLWWLFLSKAPALERVAVLVLVALCLFLTRQVVDKSIAGSGMGMLFFIYAAQTLSFALVVWAFFSRRFTGGPRYATMAAALLLGSGCWALVRTGGISAGGGSEMAWRWSQTPEERLLAERIDNHRAAVEAAQAEWPGFRGPARDGMTHGAALAEDWSATPPTLVWRRAVGPGWSSFAVQGDYFFTQEQRGDDEVVSCYRLATGDPVWQHVDKARFWEANGGAGPRGTPTLADGRVYSVGGTGIVNVLDAATGAVIWTRNAAEETKAKTPMWGFSSSPLVFEDLVVVAASGNLVAYDRETGTPRWFGPAGGASYVSPQVLKVGGIDQIVFLRAEGAIGVAPADGKVLWEHAWKGYPIVQPALTADNEVLIAVTDKSGIRRLAISPADDGFKVEERWTSIGLKPYYNDFVVHEGHAYGVDGAIMACIDLKDGERKWKGGRYGHGQVILLPDQDLMIVLSEQGEVALVKASSEKHLELGRLPVLDGKTWNHPVLVGDTLLVRNDQEMAAFRLPTKT